MQWTVARRFPLFASAIDVKLQIGPSGLIFGVTVRSVFISGVEPTEWPLQDDVYTPGSGIRAITVDTVNIEDVQACQAW